MYISSEISKIQNITTEQSHRLQLRANRVARNSGFGSATDVVLGNDNQVVAAYRYGYRKCTTGEYVPNAYRANFGWKNTYYQKARTTVEIMWRDVLVV